MQTMPATLAQQKQQVSRIWTAMLSSIVIYGVVCAAAVGMADAGAEADAEWPRRVFSAIGVVLGASSVWWRRRFLASDPVQPAPLGFMQLQSHSVVAWALSEAVAIGGLLAAFLLRDAREYIPFGAAAAALLLLHRPSNLPWARLVPPTT